ncbi:MAG TPA: glycine cleavage system aminomethyltransferase GcvT [Longimicrobiales bacterium]
MADGLKRTPLYEEHRRHGAKMVPFAGFEMPVQYTGIVAEHQAVRQAAGLFDVSHMGEIEIRGRGALELTQYVTTNDASRLAVGQVQYSVLCQEDGSALDDCLIYRFPDTFMLVVNAANRERDLEWIRKFAPRFDAQVVDRSDEIALIAIQGPEAEPILQRFTGTPLSDIAYYHFAEGEVDGHAAVISRTGYTGEDGFELYVGFRDAVAVWHRLLDAGRREGITPAGLGARDSLRLEMGYILYGNDLDENHTPLEAGLGWVVKLDKGDFLGRAALRRRKDEGLRERLVGFRLLERGFPRHAYEVRYNGESAGEVTSGIVSPSLEEGIGLAYLPTEATRPGTPIEVVIRNRPIPGEVVRPPFYQNGSIRR